MATRILGISAFYHDSAAALIADGKVVAAAQEERFTRKKHDYRFPQHAIDYCLAQAGITPAGRWYVQAGTGMAQALRMAGEKRAYTLTDRATFLAQGGDLDLCVVCEGDPLLLNLYSSMLVSPQKHPHVHHKAAKRFADFLLAPETQRVIGEFGKDQFGEPLFFPAKKTSPPVSRGG